MFGIGGAGGKGIIPAYAGNTGVKYSPSSWPRDHPRVCGEHWDEKAHSFEATGSSPRMRGTPPFKDDVARFVGIIPAYAGNT